MNESRNGMRSSLIAALLVGLLLFPAILPAGDAPMMRAENLGDTPLFTQPLLLAVANHDQRISTATDTVDCGSGSGLSFCPRNVNGEPSYLSGSPATPSDRSAPTTAPE